MRASIKKWVGRAADLTLPVHGAMDRVTTSTFGKGNLVAIVAHLYGDEPKDEVRRKLRLLSSKFEFLPVSEALDRLEAGSLPRKAAVFTVDDIMKSFVEHAVESLIEARIPFAVAPIPGLMFSEEKDHFIARLMRVAGTYLRAVTEIQLAWTQVLGAAPDFDTYSSFFDALQPLPISSIEALRTQLNIPVQEFATWDDLRQLNNDAPVEFLSHSMSHPLMWRASGGWLDWEIGESKRQIEHHLGVPVQHFAFPVGDYDTSSPEAQLALQRHGYRGAFLVQYGTITKQTPRFCLPRVGFERPVGVLNLLTSKALLRIANSWSQEGRSADARP